VKDPGTQSTIDMHMDELGPNLNSCVLRRLSTRRIAVIGCAGGLQACSFTMHQICERKRACSSQ
jgi:hypothetical protein